MMLQTFSVLYTRCVLQNPLKEFNLRLNVEKESFKYIRDRMLNSGGSAVLLMNFLFAAKYTFFNPLDVGQNLYWHFLLDR